MAICDLCSTPIDDGGKKYSASQIKKLAQDGLRPALDTADLMAVSLGIGAKGFYEEWQKRVNSDKGKWLLCSGCASVADHFDRCTLCGEKKEKLNRYELACIHQVDKKTKKKHMEISTHCSALCIKCMLKILFSNEDRTGLGGLFWGFLAGLAAWFCSFIFSIIGDFGFVKPLLYIGGGILVFSIWFLLKAPYEKSNGYPELLALFRERYPGAFPIEDAVLIDHDAKRQVFFNAMDNLTRNGVFLSFSTSPYIIIKKDFTYLSHDQRNEAIGAGYADKDPVFIRYLFHTGERSVVLKEKDAIADQKQQTRKKKDKK